jgi:non-specific serine/threonine protein kinase
VPSDRTLLFGPFRLDQAERRLLRDDEPLALRPKSFDVLAFLAERAGRLVTKRELLDGVWPETFVSDSVLKVCVREIREILGDDPRSPRYIETAHKSGYRFIGVRAAVAGNRPVPLTTFAGREEEVRDVRALLERHRLTTLVGPGGVGKTRLALEAVGAVREVWWVELAPIAEAPRVAEAVAATLGVDDDRGRTVVEALVRALRDREILLVLDNCEHLIHAAAETARVLAQGCPRLRILSTSREPLGITGEVTWTVPPLSPEDAVSLFLARSPRHAGEPARVAGICERLEGLPLAIELAAARARLLDLDQLAARLIHPLQVLTSGSRAEAARHQTMRATIDWSYDLLEPGERLAFERLSVFAGDFSLEQAERVCAGGSVRTDVVAALLGQLVDKSLVVARPAERGVQARYRLLETVRQYAAERLADPATVQARHVACFLAVAETAAERINTAERAPCLAHMDQDHANFLTAIEYARSRGDGESAHRIAGALAWFWFHRGRWREGRRVLGQLLMPATEADGDAPAWPARALFADGLLAWTTGDHPGACERFERTIALSRRSGDLVALGHALQFLAVERLGSGDTHEAVRLAEEAVAVFRRDDDSFGLATSLATAGIVALRRQALAEAGVLLDQSLQRARGVPDPWVEALALRNLGIVALRQGQLERARERLRESLEALTAWPERWFVSRSLETIAVVYALLGRHVLAAELFGAGARLREALGAAVLPFYQSDYDRALAVLHSALDAGALDEAWSRGRALTPEQALQAAVQG